MAEQFQLTLKVESHMARLNDNLFTTLSEFVVPRKLGGRFLTRFGWVRVCFTEAGLVKLIFEDDPVARTEDAAGAASLHGEDAAGEDDCVVREAFLEWVRAFDCLEAEAKWRSLDLAGTDFQKSVWRKLLDIPFGARTSYGQIAAELGNPKASRAVGSAVGANPVSLLVPCHRVLPSSGKSGNYRWGADRKLALLDAEQASGSDLRSLFQ